MRQSRISRKFVSFGVILLFLFQLLFLIAFLKLSNTNSNDDIVNSDLFQEMESKLTVYKDLFYDLVPRNEAILRAINGDSLSLMTFLGRSRSTSPIDFYNKLNLDDKNLLTYLQRFYSQSFSSSTILQQTIPILVIACNRSGVERTLKQLIKQRRLMHKSFNKMHNINITWPIVVSQGCDDMRTRETIHKYIKDIDKFMVNVPNNIKNLHKIKLQFRGYYKIASHFKLALDETFNSIPQADSVIVVEDDLDLAPDFLQYFAATYRLLKEDPSLYCISAFNDNGRPGLIDTNAHSKLYRTDFFPGLGWMLLRVTWKELKSDWPSAFWDDHMRSSRIRRSRSCIRPELSRTYTFGKVGVSNGQFFKKYLESIYLNRQPVNFSVNFPIISKHSKNNSMDSPDLSYLFRDKYDNWLQQTLLTTKSVSVDDLTDITQMEKLKEQFNNDHIPVKLSYSNSKEFAQIANKFGLMPDFIDGVPRTSYNGIVSIFWNSIQVFLTPAFKM